MCVCVKSYIKKDLKKKKKKTRILTTAEHYLSLAFIILST